jgi:signal peptidase I
MFKEGLKKVSAFFVDTIQTLLLAASIFLVIYAFVARPFQVSGESMYPTFKNNEYILTNLIGLRFGELKRGDVIVFKSPTDADKDFIKRVMALPGDSVMVENGHVYVNGQMVNESKYLSNEVQTYGGAALQEGETVIVPDGEYIVMGDNRTNSSDSREWGFLKEGSIIGKSFYVYWPLNTMRLIENPFQHK